MEVNRIPLSDKQKEAQKKYNKEYEGITDGIIKQCFEFFESISGKLDEDEINRFQSGFYTKQLKRINKIMEVPK